jgi:hypothetical protein
VILPETLDQPRITSFQGGQDGLVFPKAAIHVTGDVQRPGAPRHPAAPQVKDESHELFIAASAKDELVPLLVDHQPTLGVIAGGLPAHFCLQAPEFSKIRLGEVRTGKVSRQAFESTPDDEELLEFCNGNAGYLDASLRNYDDQPLGLQPSQRRTDRHGANPHGLGNLPGGEELPRLDTSVEDVVTQLLVD